MSKRIRGKSIRCRKTSKRRKTKRMKIQKGGLPVRLPEGWETALTLDGRVYYKDHNTKQTHWTLPQGGTPGTIYEPGEITIIALDDSNWYVPTNDQLTSINSAIADGFKLDKTGVSQQQKLRNGKQYGDYFVRRIVLQGERQGENQQIIQIKDKNPYYSIDFDETWNPEQRWRQVLKIKIPTHVTNSIMLPLDEVYIP